MSSPRTKKGLPCVVEVNLQPCDIGGRGGRSQRGSVRVHAIKESLAPGTAVSELLCGMATVDMAKLKAPEVLGVIMIVNVKVQ